MLSFDVIIWCYRLVLSLGVIIYFMLSFDVIISHSLQMLSFLCYIFPCTGWVLSFMLSFNVIIFCYHFPPFSFSWKRDTLQDLSHRWLKLMSSLSGVRRPNQRASWLVKIVSISPGFLYKAFSWSWREKCKSIPVDFTVYPYNLAQFPGKCC